MKERMGLNHSSLSCERISASLHNCFGIDPSHRQYGTDPSHIKKQPQPSSVLNSATENHCAVEEQYRSKRKLSRKGHCSTDASCCCRSTDADQDDFPYNVCNQSSDSQTDVSTSPITRLRDRKSSGDTSSISKFTDNSKQQSFSPTLPNEGDRQSKKVLVVEADYKDQSINTFIQKNNLNSDCNIRNGFNSGDSNIAFNLDCGEKNKNKDSSTLLFNANHNTIGIKKISIDNQGEDFKQVSEPSPIESEQMIGVEYFRNLLISETTRLNGFVNKWDKFLVGGNSHCPLEVCDEIRTVIGQTRLVINERFTQFTQLVDRAEGLHTISKDARPVLISDLQGFWDMIYFQVQNVDAKFKSLDHMQANQWKSAASMTAVSLSNKCNIIKPTWNPKTTGKKVPAKKKSQMSEEDKKRREAARKRFAEAKKAAAYRNQVEQDKRKTESFAEPRPPRSAFAEEATAKVDDGADVVDDESSDNKNSRKRPESIVDVITCAVAINHVNNDTTSLSSISSTGLVHG